MVSPGQRHFLTHWWKNPSNWEQRCRACGAWREKLGEEALFSSSLCLQREELKDLHKIHKIILDYLDGIFPRIIKIGWLIPWILLAGPNSFSLGTFTKYPRCGGNRVEKGVYKQCVCPAGEMECEEHKKDDWKHVFPLRRYLSFYLWRN